MPQLSQERIESDFPQRKLRDVEVIVLKMKKKSKKIETKVDGFGSILESLTKTEHFKTKNHLGLID